MCFFFFFSSRRRHTRCSRDWSSDVCSSDLRHLDHRDRREQEQDVAGEQHAHSEREPLCARRSEEHTSELQSRLHLVCRLLLEKKNNTGAVPVSLTAPETQNGHSNGPAAT